MTPFYSPDHHRRSIRLKGYDYTQAGGYFVTLVTWGRESMLGELVHGEIDLSLTGKIVQEEWFRTGQIRPYVELIADEFIVMPNHVHGIIWILDRTENIVVGARDKNNHTGLGGAQRRCAPTNVIPGSLGAIVRAFKSATTKRINALNGTPGAPLWQRNYYEHIIRNENERDRIRAYVQNNPLQSELDHDNPTHFPNPG